MRTLALAFFACSFCLLAADAPKLRLGADIRPTRYAADLTAVPGTATFSGVLDIDIALAKPASLVWLNATDLSIEQATVNSQPAAVESAGGDFIALRLPAALPAGPAKIPESGQPRGFGFVAMTNDAEAVKAINALNGTDLEGRTLTVDEARPREDRPRTDRSGGGGGQMKRIYVGNLSSSVTEDALRALFEVYGAVEGVSIMTDRYTKQPRGFAFVAMTTDAEAVKAIASLNRRDLEGGRLSVKEARPKTDRRSEEH